MFGLYIPLVLLILYIYSLVKNPIHSNMWFTIEYPENCIPIYSENTIRYTIASDNEPIIAWWFEISSLAKGTARKWQMNPWKIDVGIQPDPKFRISLPSLLQIQSSSPLAQPPSRSWVTLSQHGEALEWGRNWMNIHSPSGSQTRQFKIHYLVG